MFKEVCKVNERKWDAEALIYPIRTMMSFIAG